MADADALGFTGHESQHGFRGGHVRVVAQGRVLYAPESIEAQLVGEHSLLNGVFKNLAVAFAAGIHRLGFVNQGKFHG